jgi:hypothetical protein
MEGAGTWLGVAGSIKQLLSIFQRSISLAGSISCTCKRPVAPLCCLSQVCS